MLLIFEKFQIVQTSGRFIIDVTFDSDELNWKLEQKNVSNVSVTRFSEQR